MNKKNSNRLETVRQFIDDMLVAMPDSFNRRCGYLHLYCVSQNASMLAIKRGLDSELAAIMGMCHDYYSYVTGVTEHHGHNGAEAIRPYIRDMNIFTKEEQATICSAIFYHSYKDMVHGPYEELLKDADLLQHYLYNTSFKVSPNVADRLSAILDELQIPKVFTVHEKNAKHIKKEKENKKEKMILLAKELASQKITGLVDNKTYLSIIKYWTGKNLLAEFKNSWCASFVYHCCYEVGWILPMKYPGLDSRFAAVKAWQQWARLPEVNFYHDNKEEGFVPEPGDIVIYDQLLTDSLHDHIGVVLSYDKSNLVVAEGNMDNSNISGIVKRDSEKNIAGYIRIDEDYVYDIE